MKKEKCKISLEQIPADKALVDMLYSSNSITYTGKTYALDLLYPHNLWKLWMSKILLAIGTGLLLAGIVCFFAYNWDKLSPFTKLGMIQFGIISSIIGSAYCTLNRIGGKILLFFASFLVGIFMAVFGQIYQTGADSYQLFLRWSLLILGWTIISRFAAQWLMWIGIINLILVLIWHQESLSSQESYFTIFSYLGILNIIALVLAEYLSQKKYNWIKISLTRVVLAIVVQAFMLVPILFWIGEKSPISNLFLFSGSMLGIATYAIFYYVYRFKIPNKYILISTIFFACVIIACKTLVWTDNCTPNYRKLLFGIVILLLCIFATIHSIKATKSM